MNKFKRSGETKELQVGAGLLSPVSRTADVSSYEIVNIDMDVIVPNKRNDFSIDEIDELAELIYMSGGILQPLILMPDKNADGTYTLTTGERRWRAAKHLKEQGRYPEAFKNTVPCIFRDPKEMGLPLSDDTKELFAIMVTNQYRHKKEADQLMEVRNWTKIFQELRDNGEEYIPEQLAILSGRARYNEEGEYVPEQLKGEKTKKLVSEHMGISEGKYQQISKIEKNASNDLMERLMKNQISFSAAETVMGMPKEEQSKFLQETKGERIETEQVQKKMKEIEEKTKISESRFLSDLQSIQSRFPKSGMELGEKEYKKYLNCLRQLEKIVNES